VAWKPSADCAAHQLLRAPVGRRDRRLVRLELHLDAGLSEVRTDEIAAQAGELDHEGAVGFEIHLILEAANWHKDTKN
jgi:hypothetical protein